jgi:hypothetical protein
MNDIGIIYGWTNSKGEWIFSKDMNGNTVRPIPKYDGGGGFDYTFEIPVPEQIKGKIKSILSVEYNENPGYMPHPKDPDMSIDAYKYSVKKEHVDIEPDTYEIDASKEHIIFTVDLDYLESNGEGGAGLDVKEDWQAPLVQGRAFPMPSTIKFIWEEEVLLPPKPIEPDPYITITGEAIPNPATLIDGKANVDLELTGKVFNLKNDAPKNWKFYVDTTPNNGILNYPATYNGDTLTHKFSGVGINGDYTFPIRIVLFTEKGKKLEATGEIFVYTTTKAPTEIHPSLETELIPYMKQIPKLEFDNNIAQTTELDFDASKSTASEGIKEYLFYYKVKGRDNFRYSGWKSSSKFTFEDVKIYPNELDKSNEVEIDCRVGVRDTAGNVKYGFSEETFKAKIVTRPPNTKLHTPDRVYPKEVTRNTSYENRFEWGYQSPDNIEYKESIVTLEKWVGGDWQTVFENQRQTERYLLVEGSQREVYRITVQVVDAYGTESSKVSEIFVVETNKPDIDLTINTDNENVGILRLGVKNLTPPEIEAIYPTSYTSWDIYDGAGNTIVSGIGKVPNSVQITEEYKGTIVTVIQRAVNNLGNGAYDKEFYRNISLLEFDVNPKRLYETEYSKIVDFSRGIKNRAWKIKEKKETDYLPFVFTNNEFTRSPGIYNVWTEGDGVFIERKYIYQYSNNILDLLDEPTNPSSSEIKKLFGNEYNYGINTGKWSDSIETSEGSYKFKREKSIYLMKDSKLARMKEVEFLNVTPNAIFDYTGTLKQYKKVSVDGSRSNDITDAELLKKYPIIYDDPNTMYKIEPLDGMGGSADYSKNKFIKGEGKELVDGKVVFKSKKIQDLRFDKPGVYKISYKVTNGIKESEYYSRELVIEPEFLPSVDINVGSPVVYRDPANDLKAFISVTVDYSSPDDEIDLDKSKLIVKHDENYDFNYDNDGVNSNQNIMRNSSSLQSYMTLKNKSFKSNKATFEFEVDNADKNKLGNFKFEFIAVEKPSVPNFAIGGDVPEITANTFDLSNDKKTVFIDNMKPIINLSAFRGKTIELNVIETSTFNKFTESDINFILNMLKDNEIKTYIKYIDLNGDVTEYEN